MAAEAPIDLKAVLDAANLTALKGFADRLGLSFTAGNKLADRKLAIISKALEQRSLSAEGLCAGHSAETRQQTEMETGLQAARLTALETDMAAMQSSVTAVGAQVGQLVAVLKQQTEAAAAQQAAAQRQKTLQAEEEKAVELDSQVILFPTVSLESKRDDPAALLAAGREVVQRLGVDGSLIESAFLLKSKGNKHGPLVMQCRGRPAKLAVLRARNQQPPGSERVQLAPRLTPWQQQQKAAGLQQYRDMRSKGEVATFYCGWRLQRREGGRWVDVPVPAAP
jgi:hypothetical protein